MIGTAEQSAFIDRNKWAVVTTLRSDGSPSNSVIFYAREGDTLIFSTTSNRIKAKTVAADPRIVITVLDEGAPFGFVSVEGNATIVADDIVPGHIAINSVMRGTEFTPPEGYEDRLRADGRVIIRLTPTRVSGVTNRS